MASAWDLRVVGAEQSDIFQILRCGGCADLGVVPGDSSKVPVKTTKQNFGVAFWGCLLPLSLSLSALSLNLDSFGPGPGAVQSRKKSSEVEGTARNTSVVVVAAVVFLFFYFLVVCYRGGGGVGPGMGEADPQTQTAAIWAYGLWAGRPRPHDQPNGTRGHFK